MMSTNILTEKIFTSRVMVVETNKIKEGDNDLDIYDDKGKITESCKQVFTQGYEDVPFSKLNRKPLSPQEEYKYILNNKEIKKSEEINIKRFNFRQYIKNHWLNTVLCPQLIPNMIADIIFLEYPIIKENIQKLEKDFEYCYYPEWLKNTKLEKALHKAENELVPFLIDLSLEEIKDYYDDLLLGRKKEKEYKILKENTLTGNQLQEVSDRKIPVIASTVAMIGMNLNPTSLDLSHDFMTSLSCEDKLNQYITFYQKADKAIRAKELPLRYSIGEIAEWIKNHKPVLQIPSQITKAELTKKSRKRLSGKQSTEVLEKEYRKASENEEWWFHKRKQSSRINFLREKILNHPKLKSSQDAMGRSFVRDFVIREDKLPLYINKFKVL